MTLKQFNNKLLNLHKQKKLTPDELSFISDNRFKTTNEIYNIVMFFIGLSDKIPFSNITLEDFKKYRKVSIKLYNHLTEEKR